jgi:hypothetical protein
MWKVWVGFTVFVTVFIELLMLVFALIRGRFSPTPFVFPAVLYAVVASFAWMFPDTWVAGGEGWLMLVRGREPKAWVRTGRLTHISVVSKYEGDGDYAPYLTLRDVDGRELKTWLRKLPVAAAASLTAGMGQSSEAGLLDLGSAEAQEAAACLEGRTQTPPAPAVEPEPG